MSEDIEVEVMEEEGSPSKKRMATHSNFWALFYVWSVVIVFLASMAGVVYWFGVAP